MKNHRVLISGFWPGAKYSSINPDFIFSLKTLYTSNQRTPSSTIRFYDEWVFYRLVCGPHCGRRQKESWMLPLKKRCFNTKIKSTFDSLLDGFQTPLPRFIAPLVLWNVSEGQGNFSSGRNWTKNPTWGIQRSCFLFCRCARYKSPSLLFLKSFWIKSVAAVLQRVWRNVMRKNITD